MRELKRIVIKEELVELCEGNFNEAIVLGQMIFWQGIVDKSDQELMKQIESNKKLELPTDKIEKKLRDGWFWKTAQELSEEVMNFKSRKVISNTLNSLVEKNFMFVKENMRGKWDNTHSYKVNLSYIQEKLQNIGYALDGYSLQTPTSPSGQNDHSSGQNDQPIGQNDHSSGQNDQTVTVSNSVSNNSSLTSVNNKESIVTEEIKNDLPESTLDFIQQNKDRLIDANINLTEISLVYKTYKDHISIEHFENVLYDVIYSEIKSSFKKKLEKSIDNFLKNMNKKVTRINNYKNGSKNIKPDWYIEQKEKEQLEVDQEQPQEQDSEKNVEVEKLRIQFDSRKRTAKSKNDERAKQAQEWLLENESLLLEKEIIDKPINEIVGM
ncbi:hypothetical protein U3A55_02395 [Salarchaeum sp. III]|uniref:hypothetical protein n=1 Tax=Salarchaeum sp. III TaxID=3107927 RepID=UPI002ED94DAC